jgi:hypothetical protein
MVAVLFVCLFILLGREYIAFMGYSRKVHDSVSCTIRKLRTAGPKEKHL